MDDLRPGGVALLLWLALACAPAAPPGPAAASPLPAASGAAAAGSSTVPAAAPPTPVALRIGLNTPSAEVAPFWIAKEEGFFARYGIEATLETIPGAELIIAAVLSGEVPITALAAPALINSVLGGSDLVFIGSYANTLRFQLFARPEIATVQDLRGRPVAITGRAGIIRRATDIALRRNGLDPERDVTLVATGNVPNSLSALLAGAVDAAMLSPPATFRAEDEGLRLLVDTAEYRYPTILQGVAARRSWLAQHEDLARRVLQALSEGLAFAQQQKERTKEIIGQYTQNADPVTLERTYHALVPGWERIPYAPPEAIRSDLEAVVEDNPAARSAQPEQFVDNRLVEALDRGGFFRRLYP